MTAYTFGGNGRRYDEYGLAPTGGSMEAPDRGEADRCSHLDPATTHIFW